MRETLQKKRYTAVQLINVEGLSEAGVERRTPQR
jgi:hypothetical protein